MRIKDGGKTESLPNKKRIEEIKIGCADVSPTLESRRMLELTINDDSLSYLNLEEALNLRDELNRAILKATGLHSIISQL